MSAPRLHSRRGRAIGVVGCATGGARAREGDPEAPPDQQAGRLAAVQGRDVEEAEAVSNIEVRPEVQRVSQAMERKLRRNDHKGGRSGCGQERLFGRLLEEVAELEEVLLAGDLQGAAEEAVDVANFAMMIWDNVCQEALS